MRYCKRCLYPENAHPTIIFDEKGVCSGCRYHESRSAIDCDWNERWEMLLEIAEEAKKMARERNNPHDCIVPVGGGKDSHYQVWLAKEKLGLNPLLIFFNHGLNTPAGMANIRNLVEKSGCDLVQYVAGQDSVRKLTRHMLETVGDVTWHYHAGIQTFPYQVAVERNIPLIIWGEHGFAELTGIVTLEDFVEYTRWKRKEHDMRGYEPEDLVGKGGITVRDIAPYIFPSDENVQRVGVRGIYLSNFISWDGKSQGEFIMKEWGFKPVTYRRDRSFLQFSTIEDHANEVHDYLKYLKFGYGRATDEASHEIRHGRLTREQGLEVVKHYDHVTPRTLDYYCEFMGISKEKFYQCVEHQRDPNIWSKDASGKWVTTDSILSTKDDPEVEKHRIQPSSDQCFSEENRHLYYNAYNPPAEDEDPVFSVYPMKPVCL
jgi:N-acetyl sugar amidotransferase